jgi:tetratricopeptide (TPR) repeat protein
MLRLGGAAQDYLTGDAGQQFFIRWQSDDLDALLTDTEAMVALAPRLQAFAAGRALLLAELGRHDEAREALRQALPAEGTTFVRDLMFPTTTALLAEAIGVLGDTELATWLYPVLAPHSGTAVIVAQGVACLGSFDRYLGILATVRRDWPQAQRHFDAAWAMDEELRSPPLLARTLRWLAGMHLARDAADDAGRAAELLTVALGYAGKSGLKALSVTIEDMLSLATDNARTRCGSPASLT